MAVSKTADSGSTPGTFARKVRFKYCDKKGKPFERTAVRRRSTLLVLMPWPRCSNQQRQLAHQVYNKVGNICDVQVAEALTHSHGQCERV